MHFYYIISLLYLDTDILKTITCKFIKILNFIEIVQIFCDRICKKFRFRVGPKPQKLENIYISLFQFFVHNNDKIGKNINIFQFLEFWTDPEPKFLTNYIKEYLDYFYKNLQLAHFEPILSRN